MKLDEENFNTGIQYVVTEGDDTLRVGYTIIQGYCGCVVIEDNDLVVDDNCFLAELTGTCARVEFDLQWLKDTIEAYNKILSTELRRSLVDCNKQDPRG